MILLSRGRGPSRAALVVIRAEWTHFLKKDGSHYPHRMVVFSKALVEELQLKGATLVALYLDKRKLKFKLKELSKEEAAVAHRFRKDGGGSTTRSLAFFTTRLPEPQFKAGSYVPVVEPGWVTIDLDRSIAKPQFGLPKKKRRQ